MWLKIKQQKEIYVNTDPPNMRLPKFAASNNHIKNLPFLNNRNTSFLTETVSDEKLSYNR